MLRFSRGCLYRATDAQRVACDACGGQVPASGQRHLLRLQMLSHEVDERLGLNLICRLAGQRTLN